MEGILKHRNYTKETFTRHITKLEIALSERDTLKVKDNLKILKNSYTDLMDICYNLQDFLFDSMDKIDNCEDLFQANDTFTNDNHKYYCYIVHKANTWLETSLHDKRVPKSVLTSAPTKDNNTLEQPSNMNSSDKPVTGPNNSAISNAINGMQDSIGVSPNTFIPATQHNINVSAFVQIPKAVQRPKSSILKNRTGVTSIPFFINTAGTVNCTNPPEMGTQCITLALAPLQQIQQFNHPNGYSHQSMLRSPLVNSSQRQP